MLMLGLLWIVLVTQPGRALTKSNIQVPSSKNSSPKLNNAVGTNKSIRECNVTLTQSSGFIQSPGYPYGYPNDLWCSWRFVAPQGYNIYLSFLAFDLNDVGDFVLVSDGDYPNSKTVHKLLSTRIPRQFVSTGNMLTIVMMTDWSGIAQGFQAKYHMSFMTTTTPSTITTKPPSTTTISPQWRCNETLTQASGIIKSPGFPYGYPNDLWCSWRILGVEGSQIRLTFTSMQRHDTGDFLHICDGEYPNTQTVHIIRDFHLPKEFVSTSNVVTVVMMTDWSGTDRGFRANYHTSGTPYPCHFALYDREGEFSSPEYPTQYPNNLYCTWSIGDPRWDHYSLKFLELDLEHSSSCRDNISIYEGYDETGHLLHTLCGHDRSGTIYSRKPLFIEMKSDSTGSGRGFLAKYSFSDSGAPKIGQWPIAQAIWLIVCLIRTLVQWS